MAAKITSSHPAEQARNKPCAEVGAGIGDQVRRGGKVVYYRIVSCLCTSIVCSSRNKKCPADQRDTDTGTWSMEYEHLMARFAYLVLKAKRSSRAIILVHVSFYAPP